MTVVAPSLLTLVAELTYSCPLRCVYCSNPQRIQQRGAPLAASDWLRVIDEAEKLGALQVHFTGGEPLLYSHLELLVQTAREKQLFTNLITSGVPLCRDRLMALRQAGLEHVQLSFQAASTARNHEICGTDATPQKLKVAQWVKELGIPLTLNIVVHRANIDELPQLLALAETLEPYRIELANAQYLGWALLNREGLLPTLEQLEYARQLAAATRQRLPDTDVLFVLPDYYADRPRGCMQGWGNRYLVVTPDGLALPCHAARDLPGLHFEDVRNSPLDDIWFRSPAFQKYRGQAWMGHPCRTCEERDKDFGGCRCQAFALTGDASAADPACSLTPAFDLVRKARTSAGRPSAPFVLRRAPRHEGPS